LDEYLSLLVFAAVACGLAGADQVRIILLNPHLSRSFLKLFIFSFHTLLQDSQHNHYLVILVPGNKSSFEEVNCTLMAGLILPA